MNPFVQKIGIDLGTAHTLVFVPGKGVVVNEPSVVAISVLENKVLAVGNEAKEMIGRTPDTIVASQPLRDGAIADYRVTEAMLRYFIQKVSGRFRLIRPEVVLSIPAGVTSTERRSSSRRSQPRARRLSKISLRWTADMSGSRNDSQRSGRIYVG